MLLKRFVQTIPRRIIAVIMELFREQRLAEFHSIISVPFGVVVASVELAGQWLQESIPRV
jgi:hypothetical protein